MNIRVPRGTSVKEVETMHADKLIPQEPLDPDLLSAEKPYVGSLMSSPMYPRTALVKKTLAVGTYHIVSYFTLDEAMSGQLRTPTQSAEFQDVAIDNEIRLLLSPGAKPAASTSSRSSLGATDASDGSTEELTNASTRTSITEFHLNNDYPAVWSRERAHSVPDLQFSHVVASSRKFPVKIPEDRFARSY